MTAHISVIKPTVGADVNTWGTELNTALDTIVAGVNTAIDVADAGAGGGAGSLLQGNNLSDVANVATARTNLDLGTAAVASAASFDVAGAANAAQSAAATDATAKVAAETSARTTADTTEATARAAADALLLVKTANLSDLANVTTARTNLDLGGAALLNVGTTAGTVAAGDDARFSGGGTPDATVVTYDPSTSAGFEEENALVDGQPVLHAIPANDVAGALDYLNRFVLQTAAQWYLLGQRDSLRRVYPLVGANPSTATGEQVPGIAPFGVLAANSGAALTLSSPTLYPTQDVTLTANTTLTMPEAVPGAQLRVCCRQDATASRTLAWAAGTGQTLKWPATTVPTQTATPAGTIDEYLFVCTVATIWRGMRLAADVR